MVCPYKATTGFITAIMSILYVSSTFNNNVDGNNDDDDDTNNNTKNSQKPLQQKKKEMMTMSSTKRAIVVTLLVIFHLDLFTTGYLRAGVKQIIGSMMQYQQYQY